MKFTWITLMLFVVLGFQMFASAQQPPKPAPAPTPSVDFLGKTTDGQYTNNFFGMDLKFPSEWNVVDQETTLATLEIGTDFLKGENERSNRALEASTKREVILFHLSRKPIGSLGNCSFMIAVLKQPSAKVLPAMVAEATKSLLANSPNLRISKDTRTGIVAGKPFAMVDYELTVGEQKLSILYYVTVIKGYAFTFSLTYADDADRKELEKIVSTIRFNLK